MVRNHEIETWAAAPKSKLGFEGASRLEAGNRRAFETEAPVLKLVFDFGIFGQQNLRLDAFTPFCISPGKLRQPSRGGTLGALDLIRN